MFFKLEVATWVDRKFSRLSDNGRLLFIWCLSNPNASTCGLYRCSWRQMDEAFNPMDRSKTMFALTEVSNAHLVEYDDDNEVLWVINRMKYAPRTDAAVRRMQGEFKLVPESYLCEAFLEKYGNALGVLT